MQNRHSASFPGQRDLFSFLCMRLRRGMWLAAIMAGIASTAATGAERSSPLGIARQLNQAFAEVAEKVSPAVVVIEVAQQRVDPHAMLDPDSEYWDALPPQFKELFKEELEKELERRKSGEEPERDEEPVFNGRGSGIVIRKDGYILTNSHVVQNAEKIRVRFNNGREYPAEVQGVDELSDVAVIKIEARGLPAAKLGDSAAIKVGEFAIAIGAPFDLDYSITFGHVSGKGRSGVIPSFMGGASMDQDFIQTDASINPGNSGGPLVNIDGEVIGINTMIKGLNTGIGFAIPSNLAREVADYLISEGRYPRAWLGISLVSIKDSAMRNRLEGIQEGVVVRGIRPDGPARQSKLEPADVITAVNGKPIRTVQELRHAVRSYKIGSTLTLSVTRDGKTIPVKVTTSEWDTGQPVMARKSAAPTVEKASQQKAKPELGLQVEALTEEAGKRYGLNGVEGVMVTEVSPNGLGAKAQIRRGHIITAVERRPVKTEGEFLAAIESAKADEVLVFILSRGAPEYRVLKKN